MRPGAFTVAAVLIASACSRFDDGAWTTSFPTAGPGRSEAWKCDFSHPRHHPPPDAPPLTESEALHFVAVLIDSPRCTSLAARRRIAGDTAALRMYVDLLSDHREMHPSFDATAALAWLASSDNPRPYLRTFLSFAIVDTSNSAVPTLRALPAVTGLLRLAPESATARDRLRELARHGGRAQRALFLELLVEVNDSTARAILNEEGASLVAGRNPPDRRARDIAAVLAAPSAAPEVRGPCGYERRMGRAASGAYGCVEPVPGARLLLLRSYMPVARFEARRSSRTSPHDRLDISILGPGFLASDATVTVGHATVPYNGDTNAPMVPDTILARIGGAQGESLTTLVQHGPLVIPAIAFRTGGGSLRLQHVGDGGAPFELVVTSELRYMEREPSVGKLRLTRSDADRFVRILREAAVEAKRQDAAGVERIMTDADTLSTPHSPLPTR